MYENLKLEKKEMENSRKKVGKHLQQELGIVKVGSICKTELMKSI